MPSCRRLTKVARAPASIEEAIDRGLGPDGHPGAQRSTGRLSEAARKAGRRGERPSEAYEDERQRDKRDHVATRHTTKRSRDRGCKSSSDAIGSVQTLA